MRAVASWRMSESQCLQFNQSDVSEETNGPGAFDETAPLAASVTEGTSLQTHRRVLLCYTAAAETMSALFPLREQRTGEQIAK